MSDFGAYSRRIQLYLQVRVRAEVETDGDSDDGGSDYAVDEYEDDDDDDDAGVDVPQVTSPRVSTPIVREGSDAADNAVEDTQSKEQDEIEIGSQKSDSEDCNRSDVDGLFCPICMEAWTDGGDHQICCLPCGHIFGLSCIKKWIQLRRGSSKCPQCNKNFTAKEVRVLYASRLVAVDERLQKKVRSLEAKCLNLGKKTVDFDKKEIEWQKREGDLQLQIQKFQEGTKVHKMRFFPVRGVRNKRSARINQRLPEETEEMFRLMVEESERLRKMVEDERKQREDEREDERKQREDERKHREDYQKMWEERFQELSTQIDELQRGGGSS